MIDNTQFQSYPEKLGDLIHVEAQTVCYVCSCAGSSFRETEYLAAFGLYVASFRCRLPGRGSPGACRSDYLRTFIEAALGPLHLVFGQMKPHSLKVPR